MPERNAGSVPERNAGAVNGVQTASLVVALVSPIVAGLAAFDRRTSRPSRFPPFRRAQVGMLVSAGAWFVLVAGEVWDRAAAFHVTPLLSAAGCGSALLAVAALEGMSRRRSVPAMCAAVAAIGVGLTLGDTGAQAAAVVVGLGLAAVLTTTGHADAILPASSGPGDSRLARRRRQLPGLLAASGVVACAVGFTIVQSESGEWSLPSTALVSRAAIVAFLAAAVLLAASGTLSLRSGTEPGFRSGTEPAFRSGTEPAFRSGTEPGAVLLAAGLAVGLSAAPLRAGEGDLGAVVVVLVAAAVVAAGVRRGALSLALLALAAAAGPATLAPSSRLLATAAVLAAAAGVPWAWLAAVPGAVSLASGVVEDGSRLAVAAAVGAAAVAVLLAQAAAEEGLSRRAVALGALPALALGSWLVVAPGTWAWTGATLAAYDQGMARATAAGLLAVVVVVLAGSVPERNAGAVPERNTGSVPERNTGSVPATEAGRRGNRPDPPPVPRARSRRPRRPRTETLPAHLVISRRSASTPRPRRATRSQRPRPHGRVVARPQKGAKRQKRRRPPGPPEA